MMGGVSPETCWAVKKHWNNKFFYTVASCWFFLWDNRWVARTRNDGRFVNKPVIMWNSFLFGDISLLILGKGTNLEIYVLKKEKIDFSSFVLVLCSCLFKSTIFFPSSCWKISCEGKWINSAPVYFHSGDKAMVSDSSPPPERVT